MPPPIPLPCGCEAREHSESPDGEWPAYISFCRLHASAPKLLAALEKVVGEGDRKTGHDVLVHQTIIDAARAAIKKARL